MSGKIIISGMLVGISILIMTVTGAFAAENGMLLVQIKQQTATVTVEGGAQTKVNGEVVYRIVPLARGMVFELNTFRMTGTSVKTGKGESGSLSLMLKPQSAKSSYDAKRKTITSEFLAELHYPLIDKVKGYMVPKDGERERDDFRSYTETISLKLTVRLKEAPTLDRQRKLKEGADIEITSAGIKEKVLGEISQISSKFKVIDVTVFPKFYLKQALNIQPVFIRYTPAEGCFGGSTTATTGGSYATLRDKSIEMWNRCCIGLNFLEPVYVNNGNYRILSSTEEANLLAEYDDPNAVEVFFVEIGDPIGIHGGGASYSSGTANAKVITYDTNLPINLYNLAHELGHSMGLFHPPGNSTVGSLMEPSGFCADNPALMSKQNCDNASNPMMHSYVPLTLCTRHTNMP